MSEQEFEVYLRLIARLLQLSEAQRELIADELRDHLEARLDELMAEGLSREQAIHAAVEEFGDAAGLADQFTRITRQHTLRSRIMRTSIGALAAAAAIALAFLYMLPQNRPGVSGPTNTLAREADAAKGLPAATVVTAGEIDPSLERLAEPITVAFDQAPLAQVFDRIRDFTGVNMFVNWSALEASGVQFDSPVSLTLKDTPADTVLSLVLQLFNTGAISLDVVLDYTVMDGVIVISSKKDINRDRVVRIYDCIDLIDQPAPAASAEAPGSGFGGEGYGAAGGYGMTGGSYGGMANDAPSSLFKALETRRRARGRTVITGPAGRVVFERPAHVTDPSVELRQLVSNLVDNGFGGSVSVYDHMLVVIASHSTHQRIQETLDLLRQAKARRRS